MTTTDDGGPAFPGPTFSQGGHATGHGMGMTLRAYAAIKLCVPDSGIPWLDDMIRQSQVDRFAGQALAGIGAFWYQNAPRDDPEMMVARWCYEHADAMMAARK